MEKKWFKLLNLLPYIIILFLDFVFWPNFVPLMDSGSQELIVVFMLFYMPLISFITSLVYGIFNGFDFKLPIITIFMIVLQINPLFSDWHYISAEITFCFFHTIIYTVIVSLGVLIGYVIHMLLKFLGEIFRILFELL